MLGCEQKWNQVASVPVIGHTTALKELGVWSKPGNHTSDHPKMEISHPAMALITKNRQAAPLAQRGAEKFFYLDDSSLVDANGYRCY